MKKKSLIFIIVMLVVLLLHFYLGIKINNYFGVNMVLLMTLSGLIYPFAILLDSFRPEKHTWIYWLSASYFGIVCFLSSNILLLDFIGLLMGRDFTLIGFYLGIFLASVGFITGNLVFVRKKKLKLGKKFKFVHFSDVHLGTVHGKLRLKYLVSLINRQKPDFVFLTGDLIDGSGKVTKKTLRVLNKIKAPLYFVLGNHESYFGKQKVMNLLKGSKVNVLRNKLVDLKDFYLIGLDNPEDEVTQTLPELDKMDVPKDKPSILLLHTPTGIKSIKKSNVDLVLSGHTHSGQIFPFGLLVKLTYRYLYGLYNLGNNWIHVSSGCGTWGPPIRIGTINEIVLFEVN